MNSNVKPIPGYPGYGVDLNANIYELATGEIIPVNISHGYYYVSIKIDKKPVLLNNHRALMLAHFPSNIPEKNIVNHIDGNKLNNHPNNLEWCTYQENVEHAGVMELTSKCIPVDIMFLSHGPDYVINFPSCEKASEHTAFSTDTIIGWSRQPNNIVRPGNIRVKNGWDNWLPLDNDFQIKDGKKIPVVVQNVLSGQEFILSSQREAAKYMNVTEGTITNNIQNDLQKIYPGMFRVKSLYTKWKPIYNVWQQYKNDTGNIPVVVIKDGAEYIFESIVSAANWLNVGKSTVHYIVENSGYSKKLNVQIKYLI